MNLPNKLTMARMIMIPFVVIFLVPLPGAPTWNAAIQKPWALGLALILFILASLTDFLDGYLARKHDLVTNLGKLMDPIADKLLVISTYMAFVQRQRVHVLFLMLIVGREFLITALRLLALEKGTVLAASNFGKLKTVFQMASLIALLIEALRGAMAPAGSAEALSLLSNLLLGAALLMTILSAGDYFMKNRHLIFQGT